MSRLIVLLVLIPVAACDNRTADQHTLAAVESAQRAAAAEDGAIPCARTGRAELRKECLVERIDSPDGLVLTLRHPDGAFRRLLVTRDGRGVVAADGAEPARVAVLGQDRIAVSIAGERYELPATVKDRGPAQ